MLVGDVDPHLALEVFDDGSIESHIFMPDVSFDGGFDGSQAEVKWGFAKFGLLNDLPIAFFLLYGFDVDGFFRLIEVNWIEVGSSHAYYYY